MGQFDSLAKTLKGVLWAIESQVPFLIRGVTPTYGWLGGWTFGHFFDILLKPPQPLIGLFFIFLIRLTHFRLMADRVIFDIGWVVDKGPV